MKESTGEGFVVWLTGLSGSGKSTLAAVLSNALFARGLRGVVLDGDEVRAHLSKGLGFSPEDRDENVRRVGFVAKVATTAGGFAITAVISPFRAVREEQRRRIPRFLEVYCFAPIETLAARDPKGLYDQALRGELPHFTGVTDPYEEPLHPDVLVDTSRMSIEEGRSRVLDELERRGWLAPQADRGLAPLWGVPVPRSGAASRAEGAPGAPSELVALALSGMLAPVMGPMNERELVKVEKEGRLESGPRFPGAVTWSLPEGGLSVGEEVLTPHGAWVVESVYERDGRRFASGASLGQGLFDVRARAAETGAEVAMIVRRPLSDRTRFLVDVALVRYGRIALLVSGGDEFLRSTLSEYPPGSIVTVDVPHVPTLIGRKDALLQMIVIKNAGFRAGVLDVAAFPDAASDEAFVRSVAFEVGFEVAAMGPVRRKGRVGTARTLEDFEEGSELP